MLVTINYSLFGSTQDLPQNVSATIHMCNDVDLESMHGLSAA